MGCGASAALERIIGERSRSRVWRLLITFPCPTSMACRWDKGLSRITNGFMRSEARRTESLPTLSWRDSRLGNRLVRGVFGMGQIGTGLRRLRPMRRQSATRTLEFTFVIRVEITF